MQKPTLVLHVLGLLLLGTTYAQPFTRIDTGALVSDQGDSRSVNFVDYDNDGDLDLFVSNGPQAGSTNFLYRNDGEGVFTKIAEDPVVSDHTPSVGTTWGDYDNDGDLDLYVTNWYGRPNQLYANNGDGTFDRITTGPPVADPGFSEAASWGDYDADGDLDLYVANSDGNLRNALYTNKGDDSFARVDSGVPVTDTRASRSVSWVDYDADGDLDLFVTNAFRGLTTNFLYANNGDGTFTRITAPSLRRPGGPTAAPGATMTTTATSTCSSRR